MAIEFPDWQAFTPAAAAAEMPRLLAESEAAVAALEESGADTFETYYWALEDATRELWRVWGGAMHMLGVMNDDGWRQLQTDWQEKIVAFSLRCGQSKKLYALSKAALAKEANPVRRRILEKAVESAEHSGIALEGEKRERFNAIQARLAQLASDFQNAVIDATKAFKFEKDGKTWTIDDANYPVTMKTCADREVREKLFRARSTRAPENAERIAEILALRGESAALLGFENFAELSVAAKCAPSVEAVMKMIDDLDAATAKLAAEEDAELGAGLEPWDYAFEAEKLRERKYSYSEEELKRNFDFPVVLAGLFRMTKFLFGIDCEELTGAEKPSTWQEDVRVFAVRLDGVVRSHFYLDPYVRNGLKQGGAWMNSFRDRSDRLAQLPLAVVVLNLPVVDADGRCFMTMREVETLFHEFGHACQQMLTDIGEEGAAGINLVEWDAVEVASQFMENWCLDDRTGIVIPDELKAKVRAAKNFRAATACRRQLSFGKTDMLLHLGALPEGKLADDIKNEVFTHFGTPMIAEDGTLNAFTHIFCGGYCAGYYGYKWSEVMSADCYGAFEEAGLADDEAMSALGRRYRATILGLGGSQSAIEVFRGFRGRDPQIDALLRQQGLA